jgi:2-oxoglutarate ferredoxin oxidoreductase subunit beta
MTYLILDNNIYGLTKGQTSPTTPSGFQSKTSPYGVNEELMEPIPVFITYDISFVARASSFDIPQLQQLIRAGIEHRGFAVIYVYSPCVTYPAMPWKQLKEQLQHIPEDHPTDDRMKALELSYSTSPIYTGIFYQREKPTLEERLRDIEEQAKRIHSGSSFEMSPKQIMEEFL